MGLTAAVVTALVMRCAPTVATETMLSIARVESAFDPLAIGINGPSPSRLHPRSAREAVARATALMAAGSNFDIGLGQINSANLARLGLSVSEAFDSCKNLHAAGQILTGAYLAQTPSAGQEQAALRRALSIYNTGAPDRGFRNGYVAKVSAAGGVPAPSPAINLPAAVPASWDVFGRAEPRLVFAPTNLGEMQ
jgi:type IV secretion system protein VirB1